MTSRFWNELRLLKRCFTAGGNVILTMPDGTKHSWSLGPGKDAILKLWEEVARDPHSEKAELIRSCVAIETPENGHMGQLIHVFLLAGDDSPQIFEENQAVLAGNVVTRNDAPPEPLQPEPTPEPEPAKQVNLAPILVIPGKVQ